MCICLYVYMCIYVYVKVHVYMKVYVQVYCISLYISICIHKYVYTYMSMSMSISMSMSLYCTCIYTFCQWAIGGWPVCGKHNSHSFPKRDMSKPPTTTADSPLCTSGRVEFGEGVCQEKESETKHQFDQSFHKT